jgi:hypothetical protein
MSCRCVAVGLSLLGVFCLAPERAECSDHRAPLQLRLASSVPVHLSLAATTRPATSRQAGPAARLGHPKFVQAEPSLRQQAMQSLLAGTDQAEEESLGRTDQVGPSFRFQRQGSSARDLSRSYKNMCDSVSTKLWDEPNGRRIRFDIAGKPGVAMEIPLR